MTVPPDGNGSSVSFTTKELLARIEDKIDGLDTKLDSKADKNSVDALQVQLEVLRETAVRREGPLMKEYWDYTHETRQRLEGLERDVQSHDQYVQPFLTTVKDVDDLKTWRTRMATVQAVIAPVALATAAIVIQHFLLQ